MLYLILIIRKKDFANNFIFELTYFLPTTFYIYIYFDKNNRKDFIKRGEKDKKQRESTHTTAKIGLVTVRVTKHLSKEIWKNGRLRPGLFGILETNLSMDIHSLLRKIRWT